MRLAEVETFSREVECWKQELTEAEEDIQALCEEVAQLYCERDNENVGLNTTPQRKLRYHPGKNSTSSNHLLKKLFGLQSHLVFFQCFLLFLSIRYGTLCIP